MRRAEDLQVGKVMAGAPFLEKVPRKALDRFASEGAVHRFRRGTYLCHQGDPDGDASRHGNPSHEHRQQRGNQRE